MKTQTLEYTNGKTKFIGHLVWDEALSGRRPGVLVFPEAFGLNDHARERAGRLAQLGYVALAADTHTVFFGSVAEVRLWTETIDPLLYWDGSHRVLL